MAPETDAWVQEIARRGGGGLIARRGPSQASKYLKLKVGSGEPRKSREECLLNKTSGFERVG